MYSDQKHPHGLLNTICKTSGKGTIIIYVGIAGKNTRTIKPVRLRAEGINSCSTESKAVCA